MRVGVVGVGTMGQHHPRVYYEMPEVKLVGVVDKDLDRAKEVAGRYGVKAFSNPDELLEDGVDAVSIAVPTTLHSKIAKPFLEEGVDVLVEKPIASTLEEAGEMIETAERNGCVLCVGHIERYNPIIGELKKLLSVDGEDKVYQIETKRKGPVTRISDTGVVLDLLVHDIDVVRYLLGKEPEIVHVQGGSEKTDHMDWCHANMNYGGVSVSHHTDRLTQKKIRNLEVTCANKFISLDYLNQEMNISREAKAITSGNDKVSISEETQKVTGRGEPLKKELMDFIEATREGKEPMVNGEEGRRNLELALKILDEIE